MRTNSINLFSLIYTILFIQLGFNKAFSQSEVGIELKKHISILASDSLNGRGPGTLGEKKAAEYILSEFKNLQLESINGAFNQPFKYTVENVEICSIGNVFAQKSNADSIIIFCAHYDHLGMGGKKSRSLKSNKIHPGADDNASGVALMLSIASHVSKSKNHKHTFVFLSTSGHEDGLFGSQDFVNKNPEIISKTKFVVNLDMVGRLNPTTNLLRITRSSSINHIDTILLESAKENIKLRITDENLELSDAWSFIERQIPSITLSTGIHEDYHKTSDTEDKINYQGMAQIYNFVINLVEKLLG